MRVARHGREGAKSVFKRARDMAAASGVLVELRG
jgi:hypothetical protein